jgi:hypothetical protein
VARTEGVQGAVVRSGPFNSLAQGQLIAEGVAKCKLPAVYLGNDFVEVGGLISCGTDKANIYLRAADLVPASKVHVANRQPEWTAFEAGTDH